MQTFIVYLGLERFSMRPRIINTLGIISAALAAAVPSVARADMIDRINTCQNGGGGSCVFDILRELAANQGSGTGASAPLLSGMYYNGPINFYEYEHIFVSAPHDLSFSISMNYGTGSDTTGGTATFKCSGLTCTDANSPGIGTIKITSNTSYTFNGYQYSRISD